MRRVKVFKWEVMVPRTVRMFIGEGWFHQWGVEIDDEFCVTVAVVEMDDGKVVTAGPNMIEFVEPLKGEVKP